MSMYTNLYDFVRLQNHYFGGFAFFNFQKYIRNIANFVVYYYIYESILKLNSLKSGMNPNSSAVLLIFAHEHWTGLMCSTISRPFLHYRILIKDHSLQPGAK